MRKATPSRAPLHIGGQLIGQHPERLGQQDAESALRSAPMERLKAEALEAAGLSG